MKIKKNAFKNMRQDLIFTLIILSKSLSVILDLNNRKIGMVKISTKYIQKIAIYILNLDSIQHK